MNPALGGKFLEIFKRLFSKSLLNGVWGNAPRSSRQNRYVPATRVSGERFGRVRTAVVPAGISIS